MSRERKGEVEALRQECRTLSEQVQMLVRMERRFYGYQREAEEQLRRINALNDFALRGRRTFDPERIGQLAIDSLLEVIGMDQGVFFMERGGRLWLTVARAIAGRAGHSEDLLSDGWPLTKMVDPVGDQPIVTLGESLIPGTTLAGCASSMAALFGTEAASPSSLYVVLPLQTLRSIFSGMILLRIEDPAIRSHHDPLPSEDDIPFFRLMLSHVSGALDNALLYQGSLAVTTELEARVARRTRELAQVNEDLDANLKKLQTTQDELLHAGKMAAIGTLAAGLSHELNNPMSVILGYGQWLLREHGDDDAQRRALTAIVRHARRCANLVDALLDFSRKKPSARELTSLKDLLTRVIELARVHASTKHVTLVLDASEEVNLAYVSRVETESALLNLVNNAIDASAARGEVHLAAKPSGGETRGIGIAISDQGTGIPEDILDQVFDPFFTTKPIGQGTGLGLSLSLRIIESHGGKIDFESSVGLGTTARVWLPVAATRLSSAIALVDDD